MGKKLQNLKIKDNSVRKMAPKFPKKYPGSIVKLHGPSGLIFDDLGKTNASADKFEEVHHLTFDMGDDKSNRDVNNGY